MSDIFISYARSTAPQAQQVAAALRGLGYGVWIDDDLPAHRAYSRVIEEEMAAARAAVVIWSEDAARSEWVLSEANRAREDHKLVQLRTDKARLPMPFDTIQCADLSGWNGEPDAPGWRKVVDSIAELLGGAPASQEPDEAAAVPPLVLPTKPSIAVLPFANRSGDADQEYFADGMVEEITRALSRSRALFVIGSGSSLSFKGTGTTPQEAARTLGVRYVLTGSVRKAGGRVRIAVELIDGADGKQIWADRFEDTLEDVFALQDRVALSVAGVIEPAVREADLRRAAGRPTDNLGSYDLYLRAFSLFRTLAKVDLRAALEVLNRAIALDGDHGLALSLAAFCHAITVLQGWSDDPEDEAIQARTLIPRALRVGGDDPEVLATLVFALGMVDDDPKAVLHLADRALELNPGSSNVWAASGFARTNAGEPTLAFEHLETALRLDPLSPIRANILGMQGIARFAQGRIGEAVVLLQQCAQSRPEILITWTFLAAGHGHLGDQAAGREVIARFQTLTRIDMTTFAASFADADTRDALLKGIALVTGEGHEDHESESGPG